ncbi:MAG: metallophosphoesterase [Candidatus Bathyarchaeia archaeon]
MDFKILALSDFHGFVPSFHKAVERARSEEVDLLIVAGDITHFGSLETAGKLLDILTKTRINVVFVPGNCDPASLASVSWSQPRCIHGRAFNTHNFNLIGVGGALETPFLTFFEVSDWEVWEILQMGLSGSLNGRLIVVSHSPPKGTRLDITHSGLHIGSSSLRRFIEEKNPTCVICGHVHEARGKDRLNSTLIVNPGPARDGYCAVLEINEDLEVSLDTL